MRYMKEFLGLFRIWARIKSLIESERKIDLMVSAVTGKL